MAKRTLAAIAGALALQACASSGTNFDMAAVDRLQPGMTLAQVSAVLGQPNSITRMANGMQVVVWAHTNVAGSSVQSKSAGLIFDAQGRFVQVSSTNQYGS